MRGSEVELAKLSQNNRGAGLVFGPPRKTVHCMGGWEARQAPRESTRSQHLSLQQHSGNYNFCPSWKPPADEGRRRAALALGAAEKVQCPVNAARERSRVRTLHQAFLALQAALPTVPPDTKLSKLDVLLLATSYIAHLSRTLEQGLPGPRIAPTVFLHPLKVLDAAELP
uniref:Uncharacterized protein n=1 Tax=Sphaerodactylus townsendi TaxID=933632 RepID=A0ACB8G8S2_9SAUR